MCGGAFGGQAGASIVHKRSNGRLLIAAGIAAIGAPFAYFGMIQPAGATLFALAFLTVAYAALNTYYALVYSSIQDIVGPKQRGFTMSIYFMAMYLFGASFSPLLTGNLIDRLARSAMVAPGATKMAETFRAVGFQ